MVLEVDLVGEGVGRCLGPGSITRGPAILTTASGYKRFYGSQHPISPPGRHGAVHRLQRRSRLSGSIVAQEGSGEESVVSRLSAQGCVETLQCPSRLFSSSIGPVVWVRGLLTSRTSGASGTSSDAGFSEFISPLGFVTHFVTPGRR